MKQLFISFFGILIILITLFLCACENEDIHYKPQFAEPETYNV